MILYLLNENAPLVRIYEKTWCEVTVLFPGIKKNTVHDYSTDSSKQFEGLIHILLYSTENGLKPKIFNGKK